MVAEVEDDPDPAETREPLASLGQLVSDADRASATGSSRPRTASCSSRTSPTRDLTCSRTKGRFSMLETRFEELIDELVALAPS